MAEWSKAVVLRSTGLTPAWVRTSLNAYLFHFLSTFTFDDIFSVSKDDWYCWQKKRLDELFRTCSLKWFFYFALIREARWIRLVQLLDRIGSASTRRSNKLIASLIPSSVPFDSLSWNEQLCDKCLSRFHIPQTGIPDVSEEPEAEIVSGPIPFRWNEPSQPVEQHPTTHDIRKQT